MPAAPVADVIRAWQGLGYNRRALALHRAARVIAESGWPEDLTELPGIGPYTAAAVRNFAFGEDVLPHDVNVDRVERRTCYRFTGAAAQALMDLGATVCLARIPRCDVCPLSSSCPLAASVTSPPGSKVDSKGRSARGAQPPCVALRPATAGDGLDREAVDALAKDGLVVLLADGRVSLP